MLAFLLNYLVESFVFYVNKLVGWDVAVDRVLAQDPQSLGF